MQKAIKKFCKNRLALLGVVFIFLCFLVSLLGPIIRPDDTVDANNQHLVIGGKSPGFKVWVMREGESASTSRLSYWTAGGNSLGQREILLSGPPVKQGEFWESTSMESGKIVSLNNLKNVKERTYWLGTDKYGRDLLSRLMAGTVVSLSVGAVAVFISLIIGILIGLVAGYYRGAVDAVLMWFTNVVWSVPTLLLVMAITFTFGTGFWKIFLAVGLTMWVEVARLVRGQVLAIREREFIEAARAMGSSDWRIMFKEILPNIWSPVIVIAAANFASAILIEAGLSFLGLGAKIPTPSWGNIIREHYAYITTDMAYLAILPGLLIMFLVLSFMMVGNGLRDALDVKG